jgi:quinol monooxygenase YgiN
MEAAMRSEQVYWVFTVTVDQMDKFTPLIPKLAAATGALQFECNIGDDRKTVDFFERYTDSKAALFHQAESFAAFSKEFFAVAKPTRWVIYGMPSDEFKKANADFHPIYMTPFDGFVR